MTSQVLADFIAKLTLPPTTLDHETTFWIVYVDCSSNNEGFGVGTVLNTEELEYSLCFEFFAMNNDAEYEVVISRLNLALQLEIFSMVVGMITGEYETNEACMVAFLLKVKCLQRKFTKF